MSEAGLQRLWHADWSVSPGKRWWCQARHGPSGRWRIGAPRRVGPVDAWVQDLRDAVGRGERVALGLDVPLGLPEAWVTRAGATPWRGFRDALMDLGTGEWAKFDEPAATASEVSPARPFYPALAQRGVQRAALVEGLGVASFDALLRRCDRPTPGPGGRGAAACLFWLVGAQQVGKAAIAAWREVVRPLLDTLGDDAKLWPFDGAFDALARGGPPGRGRVVLCEAYPRQFYALMGLPLGGWSKRRPTDRMTRFADMRRWCRGAGTAGLTLSRALRAEGDAGFGDRAEGEDAFDSAVGACGMAGCVARGGVAEPTEPAVRRWEGWVLGMPTGDT